MQENTSTALQSSLHEGTQKPDKERVTALLMCHAISLLLRNLILALS